MKTFSLALVLLVSALTPACGRAADRPRRVTELPPRPDRSAAIAQFQSHRLGMFIHFGLYSLYGGVYKGQPVKTTYLEQIMGRADIPRDEFMAAAAKFDLAKFDADAICRLAKQTGMTQIVITTKHHDGFCMFRTRHTPRNIVAFGPSHRDPIAELAKACARHKIALGFYYSIIDWSEGSAVDWQSNDNPVSDELIAYECGQLKELLTQYGPISQLWFDMGHPTPEQSRRLAETVWKLQPACAVNGRVWNEQGDFLTLGDNQVSGSVVREPCQSVASIEHATWGYCSWLTHAVDAKAKAVEKARELSRVVSHGGCYLLNIGPQGSGAVDPYERETLENLGAWMRVNGEAIAGARAVDFFGQLPWGAATAKGNRLYLHVPDPSRLGTRVLSLPGLQTKILKAQLLGGPALRVTTADGGPAIAWESNPGIGAVPAVIAVDLDAPPVVLPPAPKQSEPGVFALPHFYAQMNRNGAGYYQPATTRRVVYDFQLPENGERRLLLRLAKPTNEETSLHCRILRVTAKGETLLDRKLSVAAQADRLELGRVTLPAGESLQVTLESENDRPGSILPVAPGTLYMYTAESTPK